MTSTVTIDWTLVIAVYAAVVSSLAIGWDIYKWKTAGPKVSAVLSTDMVGYNMPEYKGKIVMLLNVTNRGDRPTTLTHVTMHHYNSWWAYWKDRPMRSLYVPNPNTSQPIPHVLVPGGVWVGVAIQDQEIEQMAAQGRLYVALTHSHAKGRLRRLVKIKPRTTP